MTRLQQLRWTRDGRLVDEVDCRHCGMAIEPYSARTASGDRLQAFLDERGSVLCREAPRTRCPECGGSGLHDPACICASSACHTCRGRKTVPLHQPGRSR